jgi:hypothetical protein
MADRYWVAGGTGNYNSTTNWSATSGGASGASVPVAADNVFFNALSGVGTATINVASSCRDLNLTGFIGTIVFNSNLALNGTVFNLGAGGYTISTPSTFGLAFNTSLTITSNGTTWTGIISVGAVTITLADNLTISGSWNYTSTGTSTVNGNTLFISGNLTSTNTAICVGTTAIVFNGTGTWSHTSTGVLRNNVTINTAGTLTLGTDVRYNTGTLTYTAGTVVTTGNTLFIAANTTLNTNGISWNNISTTATVTITLGSNLTLTGTLTVGTPAVMTLSFVLGGFNIISSSANLSVSNSNTFNVPQNLTFNNVTIDNGVTINNNQISILGNLTRTGAGDSLGTTTLVLAGTGTWSHTSTGTLRNNIIINTTGTITLGTNIYYNTGTLTYTAGTVITTGNTLFIGAATTLNTNGITWNNITTNASAVITLGSNLTLTETLTISNGTTSFVLGGFNLISTNANLTMGTSGTFTMPTNQTFKTLTTTGTSTINGNTLTITENILIGVSAPLSGTTSIIYGGTGTWTAGNSGSIINNIFTINTAGTLTISGTVYKGSGVFTYTAGTIDDTSGTVAVQSLTLNVSGFTFRKFLVNNTITLTSNLNATTFGTWGANNTSFVLAGNTLNFTHLELGNTGTTTLPTAWVCQNIEFVNNSSGVLTGNSITINGNILQSGASTYSGTTTFIYAGTGSWNSTSTGYFSNSFTINTAGTLTFISANIGGGIFTYTAGTVITTGSTLYIRVGGTTMNDGILVWDNVTFGSPSGGFVSVTSITLNNQLVCLGTLTFSISNTTFSGTDGTFDVYNLELGIDTSSRTTTLVSTKTYRVRQSFICTQATNTNRVLIKSSVAASQAIFTVDPGATIDVGFVNATDIDSSLGRRVYSYRGVFSNTLNWDLLPTDVKPATGVFVN